MALSVRVLCRPLLVAGFRLAGVPASAVDGAAAAVDEMKRLSADPSVGMVLVDDELFRAFPRELVARLDRRAVPVVVPFPAPAWAATGAAEAYVLDILRQAIGYRARPR